MISTNYFSNLIRFLSCPDCRSDMEFNYLSENTYGPDGYLECLVCNHIFPVTDGIPILFRSAVRNCNLEISLFQELLEKAPSESKERIAIELDKLKKMRFHKTWEWEDVEYWDEVYRQNWNKLCANDDTFFEKLLPERIIQRRHSLGLLQKGLTYQEGLFVEIGAGTATYTKPLIHDHPNHIYLAIDMSIFALKIRRELMGNDGNKFYIMASIDNVPLKTNCVALMILIGILHHSEHKEHTLPALKKHIAFNGFIYLDEALYRPSFLKHADLIKGDNISLHEEYIFREALDLTLPIGGKLIYQVKFNTPFYNFALNRMKDIVIFNTFTYSLVRYFDYLVRLMLGSFISTFQAGEIEAIWIKTGKQ